MVAHSNAIIDPGAVMVEAFNAAATDGAMATTTCSYRLAVGTQLRAIDVL